jgi:DNA-binding GntR family transcriptional regulator
VWASGDDPVAISTAYLPEGTADEYTGSELVPFAALTGGGLLPAQAVAVDLEMIPPQPSVARSLRLLPGQPAVTVTVRFADPGAGRPAALTVVILKPDLFRIAVEGTTLGP